MSRVIPTTNDIGLGEDFVEKVSVKGWFSKEKTKGQQVPMESTETKSSINVHGNVDGVSFPFQTISHAVKSSC